MRKKEEQMEMNIVQQEIQQGEEPRRLKEGHFFMKGGYIFKNRDDFLDKTSDKIEVNGDELELRSARIRGEEGIKEGDVLYTRWFDGTVVEFKMGEIKPNLEGYGKIEDDLWVNVEYDNLYDYWVSSGFMAVNLEALGNIKYGGES